MPYSIADMAYAVGEAVVSPGPGAAELIMATIVALAFGASAVAKWAAAPKEPWNRRHS